MNNRRIPTEQRYGDIHFMHGNDFTDFLKFITEIMNYDGSENETDEQQLFKYVAQCDDHCYSGIVSAPGKHAAMHLLSKKYDTPMVLMEPVTVEPNTIDEIDEYILCE